MKMNTASHRSSGKSSCPLPRGKKKMSARHALNTARIAPRPRPPCPDGLPLQKPFAFAQKALVRRDMTGADENFTNIRIHIVTLSNLEL